MKGLLETPASSLAQNFTPLHFLRESIINIVKHNIPFTYLESGSKIWLPIISK